MGFQAMRITHFAILTATLVGSMGFCSSVLGQGVGTAGSLTKQPQPIRKSSGRVKAVGNEKRRVVTPTTGSLAVAASSSANLLVEPIGMKRVEGQEGTVPPGEGLFIFNHLLPGRYRVAGTLDGHKPTETEITIKPKDSKSLTLIFEPITFLLTINTNVGTGELRYGREGQPLNRFASILNGKVELKLTEGRYTFAITTAEFGYETRRETISVNENKVAELPLTTIVVSTGPFSASWTKSGLEDWELPAGWQDSKHKLLVKGDGVALPRQRGYRFFKDFKLTTNAKMSNGIAISFALRARDARNYYLVKLTGAKSDDPHLLRLYKVVDNVARHVMMITISSSAARPMDAGEFVSISMKMIGYDIIVETIDSQGAVYTLGVLTDSERTFPVGAVGIVGRNDEENMIERFVVCTGDKCFSE
jgi:hypothetical protein